MADHGKNINILRFVALLFTALALAPGLAHLLELPNKMTLSREEYLTVQQIYRGWAWLGRSFSFRQFPDCRYLNDSRDVIRPAGRPFHLLRAQDRPGHFDARATA